MKIINQMRRYDSLISPRNKQRTESTKSIIGANNNNNKKNQPLPVHYSDIQQQQ